MQEFIQITDLKKGNILGSTFIGMTTNNKIEFSNQGIAVVYGSNGAGKTTIARILSKEDGCEYSIQYKGNQYTQNQDGLFHVISDQLGRDVIAGNAREYFLGDNIKREYELRDILDTESARIYDSILISTLNGKYRISAKSSPLVKKITNSSIKSYVEVLVNKQDKGRSIDKKKFLGFVQSLARCEIAEYSESSFNFILNDFASRDSIIKKIEDVENKSIKIDQDYRLLEENTDAISMLDKYMYRSECIICDSKIDPKELIEKKKAKREEFYSSLTDITKKLLEEIILKVPLDDPLGIREAYLLAIKDGKIEKLINLRAEIDKYFEILNIELNNLFCACTSDSTIIGVSDEYETIISSKPEILEEDVSFIEEMVNENIDRKITIARDKNNNLKIYLDDTELLESSRDDLHLSTGEQNFLSLSFELLKAKNATNKIIVIDDPISSFDSIYKNKIAYSLLKVLSDRKQILLSHNTDLIRLLEHQRPGSFNLYLLNKTPGELNGFISIGKYEIDLLLRIDSIISLMRTTIVDDVIDKEYFLLSMIPFMRGYAHILGNQDAYEKLTSVMHGYLDDVVNIRDVYKEIFGLDIIVAGSSEYSAKAISNMSIVKKEIVNNSKYPLLNRTLNHSLMYLYLRLCVERKLVQKYSIDTNKYYMLTDIIMQAYKGDTPESKKGRVFLASKKTLLNEFNHFEGNMNIFQPAIDITDSALEKEKTNILNFLANT